MSRTPNAPDTRGAPNSDAVGAKVSIRMKDPDGGYRDILGILESETTVRKRNGQLVEFNPELIAIWRKVDPPRSIAGQGAPLSLRIRDIEIAAAKTWPPLHQINLGDWIFRASGKFTMRANSVLVLGDPGIPLGNAIRSAIDFYVEHNLDPVFHIPLPTFANLDAYLQSEGWEKKTEAHVMVTNIATHIFEERPEFEWKIQDSFDDEWLGVQKDNGVAEIMRRAPAQYAELRLQGTLVAVGRIATYESWATLTRLFVKPEYRGKGIGTELMKRLMSAAMNQGADKALLQVDINNETAIRLYESQGFRFHHTYSYRVLKSDSDGSC